MGLDGFSYGGLGSCYMGSSLNYGPFFWSPIWYGNLIKMDPKRDPNLENYPYDFGAYSFTSTVVYGLK